eukprot:1182945-Prorocentrum_minimum.AAC.1
MEMFRLLPSADAPSMPRSIQAKAPTTGSNDDSRNCNRQSLVSYAAAAPTAGKNVCNELHTHTHTHTHTYTYAISCTAAQVLNNKLALYYSSIGSHIRSIRTVLWVPRCLRNGCEPPCDGMQTTLAGV